ncbi:hypothetical protein SLEP1_g49666 [Rubroshorea leprosula]|uniref:Uncharacterized protein n=1 Tax=Rubroshorea leprosula TaxID=152421 RepID=A0AAV5M0U0_9ROSI|nr:hypothetical protein SLEP1_g49666 [Rubroshorea leprosula]
MSARRLPRPWIWVMGRDKYSNMPLVDKTIRKRHF